MGALGTAMERFAMMRPERGPVGEDDGNKVWYLRRNRLFAEATDAGIDSGDGIFSMCEMPRNTAVFSHGDPTRVVYLVKRGAVRIHRETEDGKDVTVALLGPGDMFGEEMLFGQSARTTLATVVEDALLCQARAEDLFALLSQDPTLALNVAKVLSERLESANDTMEDLAYAKIGDRIVHLLRKLAAEHGVAVEGGTRIDLRLTHAEIASLVGSTRETVTVELTKLAEAGRIRIDDRRVILSQGEMTS